MPMSTKHKRSQRCCEQRFEASFHILVHSPRVFGERIDEVSRRVSFDAACLVRECDRQRAECVLGCTCGINLRWGEGEVSAEVAHFIQPM